MKALMALLALAVILSGCIESSDAPEVQVTEGVYQGSTETVSEAQLPVAEIADSLIDEQVTVEIGEMV